MMNAGSSILQALKKLGWKRSLVILITAGVIVFDLTHQIQFLRNSVHKDGGGPRGAIDVPEPGSPTSQRVLPDVFPAASTREALIAPGNTTRALPVEKHQTQKLSAAKPRQQVPRS